MMADIDISRTKETFTPSEVMNAFMDVVIYKNKQTGRAEPSLADISALNCLSSAFSLLLEERKSIFLGKSV